MGNTLSRYQRSSRNRSFFTSVLRSRLVAAIMRTSTLIVLEPPTRSNSPFYKTLSSLDCNSSGSSPISFRNKVVPWATSKRLKAPRLCQCSHHTAKHRPPRWGCLANPESLFQLPLQSLPYYLLKFSSPTLKNHDAVRRNRIGGFLRPKLIRRFEDISW